MVAKLFENEEDGDRKVTVSCILFMALPGKRISVCSVSYLCLYRPNDLPELCFWRENYLVKFGNHCTRGATAQRPSLRSRRTRRKLSGRIAKAGTSLQLIEHSGDFVFRLDESMTGRCLDAFWWCSELEVPTPCSRAHISIVLKLRHGTDPHSAPSMAKLECETMTDYTYLFVGKGLVEGIKKSHTENDISPGDLRQWAEAHCYLKTGQEQEGDKERDTHRPSILRPVREPSCSMTCVFPSILIFWYVLVVSHLNFRNINNRAMRLLAHSYLCRHARAQ